MEPFTSAEHEALRARARAFAEAHQDLDDDATAARLVRALGDASLLAVLPGAGAGPARGLPLVVLREELARASGLVDALCAAQALAALPIAAAGTDAVRRRWLPELAAGSAIGAFALTEAGAGSDLGAITTRARPQTGPGGYRIDGEKTLISNAGLASVYVVFARTRNDGDRRPLSAFVVPADAPGLSTQPLAMAVAHPIGTVRFEGVHVDAAARLGAEGDGMRLALSTLALMRPTVGAAACGMARRALDEAVAFGRSRRTFDRLLADRESVRMTLAEMATSLEAARLLVYRAAWQRDRAAAAGGDGRAEAAAASMAKLFATEAAQQIVDRAVQIHGGQGVLRGVPVERLYREVRALRIYEGTSEIQKLIIADALLGR